MSCSKHREGRREGLKDTYSYIVLLQSYDNVRYLFHFISVILEYSIELCMYIYIYMLTFKAIQGQIDLNYIYYSNVCISAPSTPKPTPPQTWKETDEQDKKG